MGKIAGAPALPSWGSDCYRLAVMLGQVEPIEYLTCMQRIEAQLGLFGQGGRPTIPRIAARALEEWLILASAYAGLPTTLGYLAEKPGISGASALANRIQSQLHVHAAAMIYIYREL